MPTGSGLSAQWGFAEETYVNEIQTITGTPSATFGLTYNGANTTVSLSTTASAAQIQAALEALPNVGTGGVVCTGGPLPAAVTVTFSGPTTAGQNTPALVVQGAVTGLTIATPTPGKGYGDITTPTRFLEITDESMKLQADRIESKGIRPGNNVLRSDHFVIDKKGAAGDVSGEVPSKGFGLILAHAMGVAGVITTPAGASTARLHTYAGFGDNWNRSLTVQKGAPSVLSDSANVKPFTYPGCKITELDFDVDIDGFLLWKATFDAQDETTGTALATASYASAFDILNYQGGGVTVAGSPVDATKVSIKIMRPMATDRRTMRGTNLKKQPISNDLTTVTASFTLEFSDISAYSRFASSTIAGAVAALTLNFQGAQIDASAPGFNSQLSFTMPNARFDGDSPVISGMDLLTIDITATALYDGTNPALTVTYQTLDTVD
jgi:hypothetical protein